jgi:HTH-type transcriptional regulator, competence development regulator
VFTFVMILLSNVIIRGMFMEFGDYLRKLREENKLSIRQLALYSKVSASYLSQIEKGIRGVPTPEILQKLSKPLKITYEELMEAAGYLPNGVQLPIFVEKDGNCSMDSADIMQYVAEASNKTYDSLAEINKLVEKYGIEQMGFFDIEEWKNLGPEDIRMLEAQFKLIVQLAKERNEEK